MRCSVHLVATVATILPLVLAVPTLEFTRRHCNSPLEDAPWALSEIRYFQPASKKTKGTINFDFADNNTGLSRTTKCKGKVSHSGEATKGIGGYILCEDQNVQFQLHSGNFIMIAKAYANPCEDYPFNGHFAFGSNLTTWKSKASSKGTTYTMREMMVEITMLS